MLARPYRFEELMAYKSLSTNDWYKGVVLSRAAHSRVIRIASSHATNFECVWLVTLKLIKPLPKATFFVVVHLNQMFHLCIFWCMSCQTSMSLFGILTLNLFLIESTTNFWLMSLQTNVVTTSFARKFSTTTPNRWCAWHCNHTFRFNRFNNWIHFVLAMQKVSWDGLIKQSVQFGRRLISVDEWI